MPTCVQPNLARVSSSELSPSTLLYSENTLQSCEESAIRKLLKEETMAVRDMSSLMFQQKVARSYQMLHDALWKCQKKKYEKHHNTADGRIRIWLGIRQIMNSIDHFLTETRDTVKELKTRIHMGKDKIAEERRIAICIFDDVVEQCHKAALKCTDCYCGHLSNIIFLHVLNKYYDTYLPFLLEACNDMNPDAAVYGLGICVEFGGSVFKPLCLFIPCSEALSTLNVVIRDPNALQPENIMAYDNPVSAMGKICQFHRLHLPEHGDSSTKHTHSLHCAIEFANLAPYPPGGPTRLEEEQKHTYPVVQNEQYFGAYYDSGVVRIPIIFRA
ncbi:hypothetical protein ACSBR1_028537 [Camellia fascicularis]